MKRPAWLSDPDLAGFPLPAEHAVVYGVPQSGKTSLARVLVAGVRRAVFFDRNRHDYDGEGEVCRPADLVSESELLDGIVCRVVVHPDDDLPASLRTVIAACRAAGRRRPLMLVADELGDYGKRCEDVLTSLHRNGHHDGVSSLLVAHFAVDVPKSCRRSATRVLSLLQDLPDDLDALAADYGEAFAAKVRDWKPGAPPAIWRRRTLYR